MSLARPPSAQTPSAGGAAHAGPPQCLASRSQSGEEGPWPQRTGSVRSEGEAGRPRSLWGAGGHWPP